MARKGPGKSHRKGLTLLEIADMFRDDEVARKWIEEHRWPHGPCCPDCGTVNVQENVTHPTMTHRCRDCPGKPFFSVRKGSVMERSRIPYRSWAIALYLFTTNIKGISSMRLHRELGINQKSAWFMLHRLRKAAEIGSGPFAGPVEVDETYMGGKRHNMSSKQRAGLTGRGAVGKTAVVGAKDRATKRVAAKVVRTTDKSTLQGFIAAVVRESARVYTDEARAYEGMANAHEAVTHSLQEYVRGQVHVNGMESFWSMLKRGYHGTYHKMSAKHLNRYVAEFVERHNIRDMDTADQMAEVVARMAGKRLTYRALTADNGLSSGSRG